MLAPTKTLSALFISSSEQSSRLVIVTDPVIDKTSAEVLSMTGSVTITSLEDCSELEIKSADKVLVGASIRYGKHNKNLFSFSKKYKSILDSKENAFFSVNAVARKPEKSDPETNPYLIKFMKQSAWQPKKLGVFAGKIDYPKYKLSLIHI